MLSKARSQQNYVSFVQNKKYQNAQKFGRFVKVLRQFSGGKKEAEGPSRDPLAFTNLFSVAKQIAQLS
jgi:hypothetical protein